MELSTPAFEHDQQIPVDYTIDGAAAFVPLRISGVPANAASLVVISDDPDCPPDRVPGGIFEHWLVWNIAPSVAVIDAAESTGGVVGRNGWGENGYAVPEPPPGHGEHRYFFTVLALDTTLDLPADSGRSDLLAAVDGHILEQAQLVGRYTRRA